MENQVEIQLKIKCIEEELEAIEWVKKSLDKAIQMEGLPPVEVGVSIVNNETIRHMNNKYRCIDRSTDVLSFPLWENSGEWLESGLESIPLGDIVLSLPRAKEQATEYGHSLDRELAFLAIHGFLHLIGYRHDTEEEEECMFERQEQILQEIGLKR